MQIWIISALADMVNETNKMQIWIISALADSVNANLRRDNLLKRKDDVGLSGIME